MPYDKLKPCPECESTNATKYATANNTYFYIKCEDCGFQTLLCELPETAIGLWNDWSMVNNEWLKGEE